MIGISFLFVFICTRMSFFKRMSEESQTALQSASLPSILGSSESLESPEWEI